MSFKFPFTNYHELNLTWVLDQLKKLFEESSENVAVIQTYDGRLTAVETELPAISENAAEAARSAAAAASLAQTAKATADTAQENAIQAQGIAGQARQEAQAAQRASDAATQAAQQAQSVAQNFEGRITQAENDASQALEASRSFENRVQAAITTANNAAQTATNAQGIATRADQNAARALDALNSQRAELERIGAEQAALITEETESGKTEIENLAQSVLDSIPSDYTALSNLVDKKAPVIINNASGAVASFSDGAEDMKIQKIVVNIEPVQAGSGDPSPNNKRPLSGWTNSAIEQRGKNLFPYQTIPAYSYVWYSGSKKLTDAVQPIRIKGGENYMLSVSPENVINGNSVLIRAWKADGEILSDASILNAKQNNISYIFTNAPKYFQVNNAPASSRFSVLIQPTEDLWLDIAEHSGDGIGTSAQLELGSTATAYESYTANQISVTFPAEADVVYGCKITLNPDMTGALVVDRIFKTFTSVAGFGSGCGYLDFNQAIRKSASYPLISNWAKYNSAGYTSSALLPYEITNIGGTATYAFIKAPSEITTASGMNAYLAENPLEVCSYITDPITYTLTESEISGLLSTFYGVNNIWADAGSVSVDYPADTKLYIDGKLAELQATILENI